MIYFSRLKSKYFFYYISLHLLLQILGLNLKTTFIVKYVSPNKSNNKKRCPWFVPFCSKVVALSIEPPYLALNKSPPTTILNKIDYNSCKIIIILKVVSKEKHILLWACINIIIYHKLWSLLENLGFMLS